MKMLKYSGASIALLAFIYGALGHKDIAIHFFLFGFYMLVCSYLAEPFLDSEKRVDSWQKVASVGFLIASLSFIVSYYWDLANVGNFIFIIGYLVLGVSVLAQIRKAFRK
ncbi:MAG: hypothetical protein DRR06_08880 [Gammaproteobacteria bacterium]|nr:MAG: hypothetical protein DRR06_08880 [Gammaproteobacteria bacterium]RLA51903.1 MAG: hypothetical protein DRR42_09020 [Gammaproteobacteria bacterium]